MSDISTASLYVESKWKVAKGMEWDETSTTEVPVIMSRKKNKKKQQGRLMKRSSAAHQLLHCIAKDRMRMSYGDVFVAETMLDGGNDSKRVPMVSGMNKQLSCYDTNVNEFLENSPENRNMRLKKSRLKHEELSTLCENQEAEEDGRLANHRNQLNIVSGEDQPAFITNIRGKMNKKSSYNDVGVTHQSLEPSVESSRKGSNEGEEQIGLDEAVVDFRAKLADLPLSKVREIKGQLGLKLFNKAYFGVIKNDEKERNRKAKIEGNSKEYIGQHRPKEVTSKKPVSTFRPVYQNTKGFKKRRDPRFDDRAGIYKERCFEENYSFLKDMRKCEREELFKEACEHEEHGDVETAAKIREIIRRMDDREKTKADQMLKKKTHQELQQENIDRMMRGERPVFLTKAKVRMINMEKKFHQLKKEGKLEQYMKRKAKKEANKEARKKPSFEEKYGYQ